MVCYIEIDSKCPEIPMFEFLKDNKYIIKTVKLRKQISQGLIVSLKELQENFNIKFSNLSKGDDITKKLGIKKYDPELEKENKLVEELIQRSKNPSGGNKNIIK